MLKIWNLHNERLFILIFLDLLINVYCVCMQILIMQKVENNEINLTNQKLRYDLGNPFERKPNQKVRLLCSLIEWKIIESTKKWDLWPMGYYNAQILYVRSLTIHS